MTPEDDSMAKAKPVSDELRRAIRESGDSMLAVCRAAKLDPATMSRFLSGERGLRLDTVDELCAMLGLRLVQARKRKTGNR